MGKAPPSFQFYAADFAEGTDDMTLSEVGGYTRLLCSQWAKGSVPGDQPNKLAVIMRCTPATAKSVWKSIGSKFEKGDDGQYRNARLERERRKQDEYRKLQVERGKRSAEKRSITNTGSTGVGGSVQPAFQPEGQPEGNPKPEGNSLSLSLSSEQEIHVPPAAVGSTHSARPHVAPPPLVMSQAEREKRLVHCAFVGSRVEVPKSQHWQFRRAIGGTDPDPALMAWYEGLNAAVEQSGAEVPVGKDLFGWLDRQFQEWRRTATTIAAEAEFLKGA